MALNGFIKLHRKMIEWGWYSDCVVKDVFLHILMTANYSDGTYRGYELKAGDAIIGRKRMAQELGFSEQQIRTAIKKLESTGEISIKSTNKFSIVTVENWAFYQCDENLSTNEQPTNNQQITNNQPTSNQQVTTPKEYKNIRIQEYKNARIDDKEINNNYIRARISDSDYEKLVDKFGENTERLLKYAAYKINNREHKTKISDMYSYILSVAEGEFDEETRM